MRGDVGHHFIVGVADADGRALKREDSFRDVFGDHFDHALFLLPKFRKRSRVVWVLKQAQERFAPAASFDIDGGGIRFHLLSQLNDGFEKFILGGSARLRTHADIVPRVAYPVQTPPPGTRLREGRISRPGSRLKKTRRLADKISMKKSSRRWISFVMPVIFTWGQIASAYPQNDVPALKNFLQRSGWAKGDVRLRDIYEMTKNDLPLDFRFEVERILEAQPNMKLPKVEVRMIKNGRFEDVQLIAQKGRQAATATLSFRGDTVASLAYPVNGKDVHKKFSMADIYSPVRMVAEAYGPGIGVADRLQFTRFLYKDELALLRAKDRLNYAEQVREALRLAEKAQQRMNGGKEVPKKGKTPSKTSMLLDLGIPSAVAAGASPSGSCLVLGWIGTYKNGTCEPPAEAKDANKCPGTYVCSKILYGANAECGIVKFEKGQINSTAESCNMRNKDNRYDFFLGIKSQEEFDQKMKELSLKINEIRLLCKEPKNEQIDECQELEKRMAELMKVNCGILAKWKEQFTDLKCQAPARAIAADAVPGKADERAPGTDQGSLGAATPGADLPPELPQPDPNAGGRDGGDDQYGDHNTTVAYRSPPAETAPASQDLRGGVHCEGLPLNPAGLDCAGGSVETISCNSNGEARTHYFCRCGGGLRDKYARSAKPIGCEADRPASNESLVDKYRSRDRERRNSRRERPQKSWWEQNGGFQGMLGGVMTVGVGLLAYYAQQQYMKQQWAAYYQMYQPQQLRIAPPPTGPVIIAPTTPGTLPGTTIPVLPGTR